MRPEGWQAILLLVIVLLFWGAPKLPALTKSVAESLKIFKKEVKSTEPDITPETIRAEEGEKKKD